MACMISSRSSFWASRRSCLYPILSHRSFSLSSWKPSTCRLTGRFTIGTRKLSSSTNSETFTYKYVPIEDTEWFEKYRPGGYHPIFIGDVLHNRYRVADKLGHGAYSTIWLCQDYQNYMHVAVKVGTAESNSRETEILDYINTSPLDHPGKTMVPSVKDRFDIHGPNGTHPCYVTALAMCSIAGARDGSYKCIFQASTARSIIVQLVLAVDYIHTKGVVHGDIHVGNILLRLPANFDHLSIDQVYERYGPPELEPVQRIDGQPLEPTIPSSAVLPIWLGKASEEISPLEAKILLIDFGVAHRPSTEDRCDPHAPLSYVPPEARFEPERKISFSSDIWTLACSIWILLGQGPLFDDIFATPDDITAEQVDALGKMPLEWWEKWEARHKYFDENGEPKERRQVRSWEDRFETGIQIPRQKIGIPCFDTEEKAAVANMLRSMLSFEPEKRPTIQEVLKCEWMEKWAKPDFEKFTRSN